MLIFAHRGASAEAPENTLLAFETAIAAGVDGIEIDVHSVEQEFVVIHDRWLQRTTNGTGLLKHASFSQLRGLDAGLGQQVPTLWETLQCINGRCSLNIELKSISGLPALLNLLDRACLELEFSHQQFLLSSFNHHLLWQIHQIRADIQLGALTASCALDYAAFAQTLSAYAIHIDVNCIDAAYVQDAKKRQLQVFVYTVDEEQDLDDMAALGVDGVFTNYPTRALVRRAHQLQKIRR